ncbi:MAG: glycoside hydrolase family 97 catalytic domain-containing protein [Candidatus Spyradenecus sp.]
MLSELVLTTVLSVTSPNGLNTLTISQSEGALYYQVARGEQVVLAPQEIGLEVAEVAAAGRPGEVEAFRRQLGGAVPLGTKRSEIDSEAVGARVALGNGLSLEAVATDQGVAFRWLGEMSGEVEVRNERFGVALNPKAEVLYGCVDSAWGWRGDDLQQGWESPHSRSKAEEMPSGRTIYLPMTISVPGCVLSVSEAEVRDYPGMNLTRAGAEGVVLTAVQARWPLAQDGSSHRYSRVTERAAYLVRTPGTRAFPWRVFMMAGNWGELYANDLVMALSEPAVEDFSWVKPGQTAWDWWTLRQMDGTAFKPGVNTETFRTYIDFAAEYGLEYMLIDEGWAKNLDVTQVIPEVDLPGLVAYAKARGVGIVLWCTWQQLIGRQEEIFEHYAKLGIRGFKIDFFDRDDAEVARFLYHTAEVAARNRLVLLFHGIHKPTGLARTFPNVLSYEGVFGMEQATWVGPMDFVTNEMRIAFTRLLAGGADYTPGAMRNAQRANFRSEAHRPMSMGTRCRQAALFLAYDSALRMLCDAPSAYRREPDFTRLLAACPTTFDETRAVVSEDPERGLLVFRRKGRDVWVAGLVGTQAHSFTFTPPWLEEGAAYTLTQVTDSSISDVVATDYIYASLPYRPGAPMTVSCAPAGGFLLHFAPAPVAE